MVHFDFVGTDAWKCSFPRASTAADLTCRPSSLGGYARPFLCGFFVVSPAELLQSYLSCLESIRGYDRESPCVDWIDVVFHVQKSKAAEVSCRRTSAVGLRPVRARKSSPMFSKHLLATMVLVAVVCHSAVAQPPTASLGSTSGTPDGILRPWKEADAATAETGLIHKLLVKVGDVVTAGQPIAELDCQSLEIQLETARVQAASQGRLMSAQAEVALYKRKLELLAAMHLKNQSNELEEERARVDLRMAEGRLQGEMDDKRVLQLQVERLEEQLSERIIKAPISGVVVKLHKEIGEFVAANTPQVARIADVSRLKAIFYLTDNEVRHLPKDRKLQVKVSNGRAINAIFDYVLPYANDESGLIEMQVLIDHPNNDILGSRCQLLTPGPSS